MREVKPEGPRIYRDKLYRDGLEAIVVGSARWQAWLQEAAAREFVFRVEGNWHRARREWRGQRAYWYVSRRVDGQVRRFYLGAAEALDVARLERVGAAITAAQSGAKKG
jgi:LuxR family transcriptional regulator, maltose regulon positive regulatory protein